MQEVFPLRHHQLLRIKRFFGVDRWTVESAASTLQARGHVEELFPGVLLHLGDPESFCVLKIVDRFQVTARFEAAEENVHWPQEHVTHLGERNRGEESGD